ASHLGCALLALSVLGEKKKVKDVVYKVQELLDYVDPALDLADHYSKKYEEFKRHVVHSKETY
ncbi:MAG: hypothetical protein QXV11_03825, partial [Desulfurococcaceae archaeon]